MLFLWIMIIKNKKEIWEFIKLIVVSLLIIIPVRFFIAQPFIVSGSSMDQSFLNGDYLIIDEISYQFQKPERGEVVVFRYPMDLSKFFIKRIIGLPKEIIEIRGGRVFVFNAAHPEGLILEEDYARGFTAAPDLKNLKIELGEKEYYVLGDNRGFSSDSRHWGILPEGMIIGRALASLWPVANLDLWPGI